MTRVLLVTPYSPLLKHDHAANDIARPLIEALGSGLDLHVYAPNQPSASSDQGKIVFHASSPLRPVTRVERILPYPYGYRREWPREATSDVQRIARSIRPDLIHIEYLQPAEVGLSSAIPFTLTMHDVFSRTQADATAPWAPTARSTFRHLEPARVRRLENDALSRSAHVFCFSDGDAQLLSQRAGSVSVVHLGVDQNVPQWQPQPSGSVTLLFFGAMWREANIQAAVYLAESVLPLIQEQLPDARLRIVGARPDERVRRLAYLHGVEVPGAVEDLGSEIGAASLVLAPSMVRAGVLMKALQSMSAGAPVVLNENSARGLDGVQNGVHALIGGTAAELAKASVSILTNEVFARRLGAAAREFVGARFNWRQTAESMVREFHRVAGETGVTKATQDAPRVGRPD